MKAWIISTRAPTVASTWDKPGNETDKSSIKTLFISVSAL